jgi:hypothetical protein
MMDEPLDHRVYTDRELSQILKRAAELQEGLAPESPRRGFTLTEIERVAAEAGIDARYVAEAAALVDMEQDDDEERGVLGAASVVRTERVVGGELSREDLALLVRIIRKATRKTGESVDVFDAVEWRHSDATESLHVAVTPHGGRTRFDVVAKRKDRMVVLMTSELAALAAALVVADLGDMGVAGHFVTLCAGSAGGLVAARAWWRSLTESWREGIADLLDQLTRTTREIVSSRRVTAEGARREIPAQPVDTTSPH